MTNAIQEINEIAAADALIVQELQERQNELREKAKVRTIWLSKYKFFKNGLAQVLSEKQILIQNPDGSSQREQRNIVIASGTQNGKTREIIDIVKTSGANSLTIMSCDNRLDQLNQLTERLKKSGVIPFTCADVKISTSGTGLTKPSIKKFKEFFKIHKKLVFILLNNNSQCSKTRVLTQHLLQDKDFSFEKFHMIHDEADLVNKSDNAETITDEETVKVQMEWVSFFQMLKSYTDLQYVKRIWVSATPENCSLIKDVTSKDVFVLPKHPNYRGEVSFTEWNSDYEAIDPEVLRIKQGKTREIILFCTDYTNAKQTDTSKLLFITYSCPVITYNCSGILVYIRGEETPFSSSSLSIDQVIGCLGKSYSGPIIIVGNALLSRGISFVGDSRNKPHTATVMFYTGSKTATAVSIAQRIGRITGTSRPDITERRIYTQSDIFDTYSYYLKNQDTIYETLKMPENSQRLVEDILKETIPGLIKLSRDLDRKVLKKTNAKYLEAAPVASSTGSSSSTSGPVSRDLEKMKKLVSSWNKDTNQQSIAKSFRKIYNSPGNKILTSELRLFETNEGAILNMTNQYSGRWCLVFSKDDTYHYINPEAVAFARTL